MNPSTHTFQQTDASKVDMLASLKKSVAALNKLKTDFYSEDVPADRNDLAYCKKIIAFVDDILRTPNWQDSHFLKNCMKPILKMRDDAVELQKKLLSSTGEIKSLDRALTKDELKIYISLFQSDGMNLRKWGGQVASLQSYIQGRPIYHREEQVIKAIRSKAVRVNEAYVELIISQADLQTENFGRPRKDRFDQPLLALKSGVVDKATITAFMHQGKRFRLYEGELIPMNKLNTAAIERPSWLASGQSNLDDSLEEVFE